MMKTLKTKVLAIIASLTIQAVSGMSEAREWEFVPFAIPAQISLPRLEEQRPESFRGRWEFSPYQGHAYQALLAQAQVNPDPRIREMIRRFAEKLEHEYQQTTTSSSSSSSHVPLGSKRKRENSLDKGQEPDEEESSQQPPQVKAPKRERKELSHKERGQAERSSTAQSTQFTNQQIQELLNNQMTIPLAEFTEEKLSALHGLDRVGVLIVALGKTQAPGNTQTPNNLIELIEQYFPNVLSLELYGLNIGNAGFEALAQSKIAAQLKSLDVGYCAITPGGFTTQNLNQFKNLVNLKIDLNTKLGKTGLRRLSKSTIASQLKMLTIGTWNIEKKEFTTENLNKFKSLEHLNISYNYQLGDIGFNALAESKVAAQLKTLIAIECFITSGSFTTKNLNKFKSLEYLGINHNKSLDENTILAIIAHSNVCQTLQTVAGLTPQTSKEFKAFCPMKTR